VKCTFCQVRNPAGFTGNSLLAAARWSESNVDQGAGKAGKLVNSKVDKREEVSYIYFEPSICGNDAPSDGYRGAVVCLRDRISGEKAD
jgi:hypothetical protein